ncbi:hypothetical protein [Streptomyces sp. NPDC006997]
MGEGLLARARSSSTRVNGYSVVRDAVSSRLTGALSDTIHSWCAVSGTG